MTKQQTFYEKAKELIEKDEDIRLMLKIFEEYDNTHKLKTLKEMKDEIKTTKKLQNTR